MNRRTFFGAAAGAGAAAVNALPTDAIYFQVHKLQSVPALDYPIGEELPLVWYMSRVCDPDCWEVTTITVNLELMLGVPPQ